VAGGLKGALPGPARVTSPSAAAPAAASASAPWSPRVRRRP